MLRFSDVVEKLISDVNIRALPAFLQDRSEVWTATVTLGSTNDGRRVDLAVSHLGTDLDQLLFQARQRPVLNPLGRR